MLSAALYCRISREDGDNIESSSILSQKAFLTEYAKKNKYTVFDCYIDDGYSGVDFNRPDFNRMIKDIEKGFIQVVIVKDLSRLGRNYLKSGYYLEEYFPEKRIKFIAINDNYDSGIGENEFAPFKNIMNEWYAKDISKKIKSTHRLNQEKGMIPTGKLPLYGYVYNKDRKRIPNPETSKVVHFIYHSYANGMSYNQIAEELQNLKVYTPGYWHYKIYNFNPSKFINYDDNQKYQWKKDMISNILNCKEYNGDLIVRKTTKVSYKNHKQIKNDESDILVFEKLFDPIVEDEIIKKVEKILKSKIRSSTPVELSRYKGLCFCKNCGKALVLRKYPNAYYYLCHNDKCQDKAFVKIETIDNIIKQEIYSLVSLFKSHKHQIKNYAKNYITNKKPLVIEESLQDVNQLEERNKKLDSLITKLFESEVEGSLPKATYERMLKNYTDEKKQIELKLSEIVNKTPINNEDTKDLDTKINDFFNQVITLCNKESLDFNDLHSIIHNINIYKSKKKLEMYITYNNINLFLEEFIHNVLKR